jgi:DNA ligase (NAD+)
MGFCNYKEGLGMIKEALKRVGELRKEIEYHRYCYDVLNHPEISDEHYDSSVEELKN